MIQPTSNAAEFPADLLATAPPALLSPSEGRRWYRCWPLGGVLAGFAIALLFLWNNGFSIAMADGIAYIVGGLNLVTTGQFINPYGEYETWFPPLYPMLIGLVSVGGRIDPVAMARLICAACSLGGLVLVWRATLLGTQGRHLAAFLATIVLAGNAMYQIYALAVMSHAAATACGLAAFVVWLRMEKSARWSQMFALGSLIGAGFLIRPEVLLTLPLWLLIDAFSLPWRETIKRTIVSGLACALFVIPYAVYLHQVTGQWQLSAKGEVTVAIGRSIFYGGPRERIDPESLELQYSTFEVTPTSELRRYGFNALSMWRVVITTVRGPIGFGLLLASLLGGGRLIYERKWRFLFGLLAQLAFLGAIAATWCEDRMLHALWPVLAVLAGIGLAQLCQVLRNPKWGLWLKGLAGLWLAWAALGWLEGATRQPRWSFQEGVGPKLLLKEAGLAFRQQTTEEPHGAMYELGATVGYYAGQYRRPMPTTNDLDTLIRYAQKRDTPYRPAWLALWTGEADAYHPTIKEPFLANALPLKKVLERSDGTSRVAIYEIPVPFDPTIEKGENVSSQEVHTWAGDSAE